MIHVWQDLASGEFERAMRTVEMILVRGLMESMSG